MHPTDLILFRRLRRSERAAFEAVVSAHYEAVFRQHYLLCRDRERAADLTQETFVEAWQSLPRFGFRASLQTWLYRIAVRVWQRRSAQDKRLSRVSLEFAQNVPMSGDGPEAVAVRRAQTEQVVCALAKLSPDLRTVIVLHYEGQLSLRETALALDVPVGTVKSRLSVGLRRLRRLLGEEAQ